MPALEFVSQSVRDTSNATANAARLVNRYPEAMAEGARARFALKIVPGTAEWAQLPGAFMRALAVVGDSDEGVVTSSLFAVIGGEVYEIELDGSSEGIGSVPDDVQTTIAGNNGDVCIVAGGEYHLWDGSTLTQPTIGAFADFGSVEFLGGYTILTELGGRRFQWSALADASDLPGLNFASAESRDDALLRAVAIAGNLWLLKTGSIEIWARTGEASENAFTQLPGGVLETGLREFGLVTKMPNGAFFVGNDGIAYITAGAELKPVSTPAVEVAIRDGDATHCLYYEDAGHKFCVLRFRDRPAWCFDLSTGLWHERATGNGAWSATVSANFGGWRVGQVDGRIGTLTRNGRDIDQPLAREVVSLTLYIDGQRFRIPKVEFTGRMGRSDIGRDAQIMVQFSRDGGQTWGAEQWRSMGNLGDFDRRAVLRNVGQARTLTARIRDTDPADITLWSSVNLDLA
jgi:hypothetical protein